MFSIKQNAEKIIHIIETTAKKNSIDKKIELIAVSKTKPIEDISAAIAAGLRHFGENYVQEAVEKISYFNNKESQLVWHLIGPMQSNKTRLIAENFDWVHTLASSKIANRLNEQRLPHMPPLQVLIQVNTSLEATKSGIAIDNKDDIIALAKEIEKLPNLSLRGLMCIPKSVDHYQGQLAEFAPLTSLFNELKTQFTNFDTLSMGMSDDMQAAIASGSTMVRVGSAIFGSRNYHE